MFFERGIHISPRRLVLFFADVFCLMASIIVSAFIRLSPVDGWEYVVAHIPTLSASCLIFLLVFYMGGMYEREAVKRKKGAFVLPLVTTAIGLVIIIVVFYAQFKLYIGRGILMLAGIIIALSVWASRVVYRVVVGYGFLSKRSLIVGDGRDVLAVLHLLSHTEDSGYRIFGIVSCSKSRPGEFVEGVPILGQLNRLREFVDVYDIETIIMATSLAREHTLFAVLRPLRYQGTEILDDIALHEELALEIPLDHIDDEWLMNAAMNSSVIHIRQIKRFMDVIVSILGLIVLAPVFLLGALAIKLDSSGPVLYRQRRAGRDGRSFILNKLRTMKHNAEVESGVVWAGKGDARTTRVGRILRKWRVDEIPQLVNVLRGEMSLVGPRPERSEFIDTLSAAIPYYRERLLVHPGITGWAQIMFPYAASIEASRRKLQYDLYYIKHMSFILDVVILLRTFKTIIMGLRHEEDEEEKPAANIIALPLPEARAPEAPARKTRAM